jgi:hypothetical protein
VSFHGTDQAYRLFQTRDFDRRTSQSTRLLEPAKSIKTPGFLVEPESAFRACLASMAALCSRSKVPAASKNLKYLYRDASLTGFHAPTAGIANSFLLHCALILAILFLPLALPTRAPALNSAFLPPEVIFYPVPEPRPANRLPRIAPRGPGGRPGSGIQPKIPPAPGKTISNADLTAISKPLHPDNKHQTIVQPASPPDLRIPNDVKLPNLSLGSVDAPKKPTFDLSIKKPTQENGKLSADMATPVAETNSDFSLATNLQPTNSQPKLPIPTGGIPKPVRRDAGAEGPSGGPEVPEIGVAGDGRAILAIGIDPSAPNARIALPPGSRWGDFSIAPGAGNAGAPGGRPNGAPGGGGSGGNGRAGDESVGIGPGKEGGGGGKDGPPGSLSIKATGNSAGGVAMLDPRVESKMIFPVALTSPKFRKNQMIVSAGPIGGGGLGVYGALPCSKIYTIFLPMDNSNWTMQYCQKSGPTSATPAADQGSTVIRLETGLVPPDPDLESRFDFKRLSVPPGKGHQMIVLKGTLREDGAVDGLEVYQGLVPQMDEAARLAFSKWKFKPAMRAGKPVSIELLVGIPPEITPGSQPQ